MKNNLYKVTDRNNYSLFIIPKMEDTYDYLSRNFPFKIKEENIFEIKNKDQKICYVFNDANSELDKIISSRYVLNRNSKYSGKIYVKSNDTVEELFLNNGKLLSEKLLDNSQLESGIKTYSFEVEHQAAKNDLLHKFTKEELLKKGLVTFAISLFAAGIIFFAFNLILTNINQSRTAQIEAESQLKEELLQVKREEKKLSDLKKVYESHVERSNKLIYPMINIIYNCIGNKSNINSLSINKNSFSIEVITKNSLEILSRFESEESIKFISINRTASEFDKEIVSFNGEFKNTFVNPPENLSVTEQIVFYEKLLAQPEREIIFSSYAQKIRNLIKANNCSEEYMQVKNVNDFIELECNLHGKGVDILKFVKQIDGHQPRLEVKSLRIRNLVNSGLCNANIVFETFIDSKQLNDKELSDFAKSESSPDVIGKVFTNAQKSSPVKNYYPKKSASTAKPLKTSPTPKINLGKLDYIGNGQNATYSKIIFLKSPVSGSIYKVPVVQSPVHGDYAIEYADKFHVFIGSSEYEVKK